MTKDKPQGIIISVTHVVPRGHQMGKGDKMMEGAKTEGKKYISDMLKVPYGASKKEAMAMEEGAKDPGEGDEFSSLFGSSGDKGKDPMKLTLGEASVDELKAALAQKEKEEKPGAAPGEGESDLEDEDEDMA